MVTAVQLYHICLAYAHRVCHIQLVEHWPAKTTSFDKLWNSMSLFFRHLPSVEGEFTLEDPSNKADSDTVLLSSRLWAYLSTPQDSRILVLISSGDSIAPLLISQDLECLTCWANEDPDVRSLNLVMFCSTYSLSQDRVHHSSTSLARPVSSYFWIIQWPAKTASVSCRRCRSLRSGFDSPNCRCIQFCIVPQFCLRGMDFPVIADHSNW